MSGQLRFAPEEVSTRIAKGVVHKVLVVDDDPEVHAVTRLMLGEFRYEGRRIELLHAQSANEARELLAQHAHIALVLLDVVMETDRSGLDLVHHIRGILGNTGIRIVLRTGQPGQMPEHQIVTQYAIDDYVLKSELTFLRVQTLVTTALRTFELVRKLEQSQDLLRKVNAELALLSQTDPLTGLWNRRRFDEELEREWRRLTRERLPASILMIDVDYFKAYNDSEGHPAGDRVLRQIAAVLADTLRRGGDIVCRYGGEEFLVLLAGLEIEDARQVAELVRTRVQDLALKHPRSPHGVVTVSVGCSSASAARVDDASPAALIDAADRALYQAKHDGRNRVSVSTD